MMSQIPILESVHEANIAISPWAQSINNLKQARRITRCSRPTRRRAGKLGSSRFIHRAQRDSNYE